MKTKLLVIMTVFFCGICGGAQCQEKAPKSGCDFLKGLQYKNGTDTIIVLAYKNASVKMPPNNPVIDKMSKEGKLHAADYYYCVDFKPISCNQRFIIACSEKSSSAFKINQGSANNRVKLRCIVFEEYSDGNHPFFVIDKILPTK